MTDLIESSMISLNLQKEYGLQVFISFTSLFGKRIIRNHFERRNWRAKLIGRC